MIIHDYQGLLEVYGCSANGPVYLIENARDFLKADKNWKTDENWNSNISILLYLNISMDNNFNAILTSRQSYKKHPCLFQTTATHTSTLMPEVQSPVYHNPR